MENTHEKASDTTSESGSQSGSKMRTQQEIDKEYTMLAQQVGDMILKVVPYMIYALGKTAELTKEPRAKEVTKAQSSDEALKNETA